MENLKYYFRTDGSLIGGYGHPLEPDEAFEGFTLEAPEDARQTWDGETWGDVPVTIPQAVSAFQARSALAQAELLDTVEALISDADQQTRIAWEYATEFQRASPTIATLAGALNLSPEQVDELFIAAAQITA